MIRRLPDETVRASARRGDQPVTAPRADVRVASDSPDERRPGSFDDQFVARFDELFQSLFRYLDRLTGDAGLASDLAQDALTRLYQRRAMPDDVRAWLVSVAHNRLRTHERQARRRRWLLVLHRDDVPSPRASPLPDAALAEREGTAVVRAAVASLTRRDRAMLLLRMEGYSYREIARLLRLTETSVGTLLSRAKAAFVRALREAEREHRGASD